MSDIKRYAVRSACDIMLEAKHNQGDTIDVVMESEAGEYVRYSDYEAALAAERQRCRKEEVEPLMTAIQHEIDWHMEVAEQATDQGLRVNSQSKPFAEACFKDAAVYTGRARLLENVIAAVRAVQEEKP